MERVAIQLAGAQQSVGHTVKLLALRGGPLDEEAHRRGIPVCVLPRGKAKRMFTALRYFLTERPHIVHVHNATSLHYAVWARMTGAKVVVTLHGDRDTHARLGTAAEWWLTSAAIVVSDAARRTLCLPGRSGEMTVIHNGIASAGTRSQRSDRGERIVGIMVARMDGRKGHDTLLRSLVLVRNAGVDVTMLIVGDGHVRPAMEALGQELGFGDGRVQFLGRRSDIDQLLADADFFVLPSDIEGLPLSILEAMAHGLPIIASDIGGIPELIRHDTDGLLVPPGKPDPLADAIRRVASDPILRERLGKAAKAKATAEFSLDATSSKYEAEYRKALGASVKTCSKGEHATP
ncbi:MAG TPA: glycosyltransferase family 4 protein [Vicinamibacterales bacterium]|nr:glycosyltransferase family 4 protein [Vicinamibacterales bacterium]